MKAKLVLVTASVLACAVWWSGCSSDPEGVPATGDAGGGGGSEGGSVSEGGTTPEGGGATDAAKDAPSDTSTGAPYVDISYGAASCPAFTACGGDTVGAWKISGGCVTEELLAQAKARCPGLVESDVKFQARGNVVATAAKIARNIDVKYTAKLAIPPECKPTQAPFNTCAAVGTGLTTLAKLDSAACVDDGATGGCKCDVADSFNEASDGPYTTAGNTLTTGAGSTERTFDYCVNAGTTELKYRETTAEAVPALFVLTK